MEYPFDHENLDVYKLALEVARACAALGMAAGRNHYRIAAGSAAEALAQQPKLRREGAMLRGLTRKRRPSRRAAVAPLRRAAPPPTDARPVPPDLPGPVVCGALPPAGDGASRPRAPAPRSADPAPTGATSCPAGCGAARSPAGCSAVVPSRRAAPPPTDVRPVQPDLPGPAVRGALPPAGDGPPPASTCG